MKLVTPIYYMTKFQHIFISQNMTLLHDDKHDPLTRSAIAPLVTTKGSAHLQPYSLLDSDLIEGVHRVFDALSDNPALVGLHADLNRIIDYPLNAN